MNQKIKLYYNPHLDMIAESKDGKKFCIEGIWGFFLYLLTINGADIKSGWEHIGEL